MVTASLLTWLLLFYFFIFIVHPTAVVDKCNVILFGTTSLWCYAKWQKKKKKNLNLNVKKAADEHDLTPETNVCQCQPQDGGQQKLSGGWKAKQRPCSMQIKWNKPRAEHAAQLEGKEIKAAPTRSTPQRCRNHCTNVLISTPFLRIFWPFSRLWCWWKSWKTQAWLRHHQCLNQAFESTEEPHTPDGQVNGDGRRDRCLTLLQIQEKRRHMHFFLSFKFIFILSCLSLYLLFNVSISFTLESVPTWCGGFLLLFCITAELIVTY